MTLARRLAALETDALDAAVARFRADWHAADDTHEVARFWDELARAGFPESGPAAIAAWEATRPAEERAGFAAVDGAIVALLDLGTDPARLRTALGAAAPHLGLPATAAPHRVVAALTAALSTTDGDDGPTPT